MSGALLHKLRSLRFRDILSHLKPEWVDLAVFVARLGSCEPKALAKVEIVIEKVSTPSRLTYKALIGGREVHRSLVRSFRLRTLQLGFGKGPVIESCFTAAVEVYIWADPENASSIAGMERAGFEFVARCKGLCLGPFIVNRSREYRRDGK